MSKNVNYCVFISTHNFLPSLGQNEKEKKKNRKTVQKQQQHLSSCIRCVRVCVVSKFLPSSGGLTVSTDRLCFSFLYSELKKNIKATILVF